MEKGLVVGLGILALGVSGCSSMFGSQKRINLFQSEIDRVSAEKSVMERELRDERDRRERAEAIVMTDRERKMEEIASSSDLEPKPSADKPATAKPQSAKEVQKALANAGYDPGPIDGKLGKKTQKAIVAFQKGSGLKPDGKVGPKTWGELGRHLAAVDNGKSGNVR